MNIFVLKHAGNLWKLAASSTTTWSRKAR